MLSKAVLYLTKTFVVETYYCNLLFYTKCLTSLLTYFTLLFLYTRVPLQSSKVKWRRRYRMLEQQQALVARLWDLHTQVKDFQGDREKKVLGGRGGEGMRGEGRGREGRRGEGRGSEGRGRERSVCGRRWWNGLRWPFSGFSGCGTFSTGNCKQVENHF